MKRALFILSSFMLVYGCTEVRAIIVKIGNIRGSCRNILVMARSGKDTKPVYGTTKSEKGKATARLESMDWEKFDLPVFRDENGSWQMDILEGEGPAEGYALKSYEMKDEEATFKLKLYYPVNQWSHGTVSTVIALDLGDRRG